MYNSEKSSLCVILDIEVHVTVHVCYHAGSYSTQSIENFTD